MGTEQLSLSLARSAIAIALLFAAGCAAPASDRLLSAASPPAISRSRSLQVPFFPQTRDHCGPAALAMALGWAGDNVTPDEIAPRSYRVGRSGSLQIDLLTAARRRGRPPYPVRELSALLRELEAGHPVLVLQRLGVSLYPAWHFAVAIGYDLDRGTLRLHTGAYADHDTPLRVFERSWAGAGNWAIVVLPPDQLPVSADESSVLQAIAGLERAQRFEAAERAYHAARGRWPESLAAELGIGNARYARGDLRGAESAFRFATARHPSAGAAFNNLAHVLLELGEMGAARDAVERAIALGGAGRASFERTLREIDEASR